MSAAGAGLAWYMGIEKIDENFCYDRGAEQNTLAILLDNSVTDPSDQQKRDYRAGIGEAVRNATPNTKIIGQSTSKDKNGTIAPILFTLCKPPETEAEQEAIGGPSLSGARLKNIAAEAKAALDEKLDEMLGAVAVKEEMASDSPLLEQLQSISRYAGFQGPSRQLVIISDGLQNTEYAQFCRTKGHLPPWEVFKQGRTYRRVKPDDLAGTDVTYLMVESFRLPNKHYPHCSNDELAIFWEDLLYGSGADSVVMHHVRRGAD